MASIGILDTTFLALSLHGQVCGHECVNHMGAMQSGTQRCFSIQSNVQKRLTLISERFIQKDFGQERVTFVDIGVETTECIDELIVDFW